MYPLDLTSTFVILFSVNIITMNVISKLLSCFCYSECMFQGGSSFVDHFCYLCLVFVMLLRLFIAALWSPEGKGLTS